LKQQVDEGRKIEEILKKQEKKYQVEVNILKGKLEEKDKHLQFHVSTKILDNILSNQRSPATKFGLGFHEIVKGKSRSQVEARNSNEKYEILKKEIRSQSHQQPRKENIQMKSFTPNYISESILCCDQ